MRLYFKIQVQHRRPGLSGNGKISKKGLRGLDWITKTKERKEPRLLQVDMALIEIGRLDKGASWA